jgi:hypothetical protein
MYLASIVVLTPHSWWRRSKLDKLWAADRCGKICWWWIDSRFNTIWPWIRFASVSAESQTLVSDSIFGWRSKHREIILDKQAAETSGQHKTHCLVRQTQTLVLNLPEPSKYWKPCEQRVSTSVPEPQSESESDKTDAFPWRWRQYWTQCYAVWRLTDGHMKA